MKIIYDELFDMIPKEMMDKVFEYDKCELSADFLGFTEYYKALASVIPKGMTVIDFGCYQAVQSWYFKDHNRYIGIDVIPIEARLRTDNSLHFQSDICKWIMFDFNKLGGLKADECFAICNYVPDWGAQALIKQTFQNVFNYYPTVNRW